MKAEKQSEARERILEVAERLFYADGVRATGTEKIMAMSEVAKATFYRHFKSKDDLVLAYLDLRDQKFWDFLLSPSPPDDIQEALTRLEQLVNLPEVTSCPFLRIASEYPDKDHPFHRRAIEHQGKFLDYLSDLLRPITDDSKAPAAILGVIDGALTTRMIYGTSKEISLKSSAEAILKSFQSARIHDPSKAR